MFQQKMAVINPDTSILMQPYSLKEKVKKIKCVFAIE